MEEEKEPEGEENMIASDGEREHCSKKTTADSLHKSDMKLEDQNEMSPDLDPQ